MTFFKDIDECTDYMITHFKFSLSKENIKFAEKYFEFNQNLKSFMNKEYKWDCLGTMNVLLINNFLMISRYPRVVNTGKASQKIFIKNEMFRLDTQHTDDDEVFLKELKETKTEVYNQNIYELSIRDNMIKNLKEIKESYNVQILESVKIVKEVNSILNECTKEKIDISKLTNLEIKSSPEEIYPIIEELSNMLLLLKDIDMTEKLEGLYRSIYKNDNTIKLS